MNAPDEPSSSGSSARPSSPAVDPASQVRVAVAKAEHEASLLGLFERTGVACHCQYWHFTGDKNAWLDRLFNAPERNREALGPLLKSEGLQGLVASVGDRAVGWMKLCPAERVAKLYEQRLYKNLPCFAGDRAGVYTIGCLLVDETHRRQGVARALLAQGLISAKAQGARAIEAFPRCGESLRDDELWTGPVALFIESGFKVVNDFRPYPVLRHELS